MYEFMTAVIRIARFISVAAVLLLIAVAAGLIFAPELLWQLVRYALALICIIGAVGICISWIRRRKHRT